MKSTRTMTKAIGAVFVGLSIQPLFAQPWEWLGDLPVTNHVASGTETLAARTLFGNDQRVYKTGAGEWVTPCNLFDLFWPITVKTVAGSLQVGVGSDAGTDPGAFTLPTSITDKALLWVDAADPQASHLAGSGDEVSIWYDRREGASVASPQYYYAQADSDVSTGGNPVKATFEGRTGVYFGGVGSFKCMPWHKKDGTRCITTPARIAHFWLFRHDCGSRVAA